MEKVCFDGGVNVICFLKNGIKYGMTCAWGMQVDYDKVLMLLGSQSVTGKVLEVGDEVGLCALNNNQVDVSNKLGAKHSDQIDKFKGLNYRIDGNCILFDDSSRVMKAKVIDIIHLKEVEEDNLIYLRILENKKNDDNFLTYSSFLK